MGKKNRVWLALGSNLGDSRTLLHQAWFELGTRKDVTLICLSRPYITEPVGMDSENQFVNAVGILETEHTPQSFLSLLQQVEKTFGRTVKTGQSGSEYQDRLLDLDMLYYNDLILTTDTLLLPHPHIAERLFVLAPLVEIDPRHIDPGTGMSVKTMHEKLLRLISAGEMESQGIRSVTWS